jgi:hypothetical protein
MYALINTTPFHWNITTTPVPEFPLRYAATTDGSLGALIAYMRKEILTITAKHMHAKHYHDTGTNICCACFDILDTHVNDAHKTAPLSSPNTVGWNSTMLPDKIFNQLMTTCGKPTPNAVRQNNLTFLLAYNPKDPPELLFKQVADCQEIAIVAKVPYTTQQLLMNVIDLFTRSGAYARDMDDWERKPAANQTYFNLHPFIQAAYQRCLASGVITATASGYATNNRFAGLTAEDDIDNMSDAGMTKTIVNSINTHMANLSASVLSQTTASTKANAAQLKASMQQIATNKTQRNREHALMMQQFAMMSTTNTVNPSFCPEPTTQRNFIPSAITMLAPHQQWTPPGGGGSGSRRACGGRGRRPARIPHQGTPMSFASGNQLIPYIPAGIQPIQPQNPCYSNVVKQWANQNVCFSCGFDVEDWHNSSSCPRKKPSHQDGFTRTNYLEYEQANHQFCRKAMHKTMYPNM